MIYVGIDVASDKHDFMIMTGEEVFYTKKSITIPNNRDGFEKLHKSIQEFCGAKNDYQVRIGLESTGFYHKAIIKYLLDKNYQVALINPILTNMYKKSIQVHSPKTDNIDSRIICKFLLAKQNDFRPYTMKLYHSDILKSLSRARFGLVEDLKKAKLAVYRTLVQQFPEFLKLFSNPYQGTALKIITKYPNPKELANAHLETLRKLIHGSCKVTAEKLKETAKTSVGMNDEIMAFELIQHIKSLNFINEQISEYDKMIKIHVDALKTQILTVPGVGYVTAAHFLGEIGDITNFKNADSITSFAGLDLEVYESGKFAATNLRASKKGSRYLRYAIFQIAKTCWIHDKSLNQYYHKKKAENKHHLVIIGHLQKKMIRIIYSILKSGKAYTPH